MALTCPCLWNNDSTMHARDPLCEQHGDQAEWWRKVRERAEQLADDTAYDPDTDEDYGTSRFFG